MMGGACSRKERPSTVSTKKPGDGGPVSYSVPFRSARRPRQSEGCSLPTYSSWLNQVEVWFSKIQRDIIARGIFTSLKDLDKKIMRYIRLYNHTATPIKWSYQDASNRIKSTLEINETVH